MLGTQELEPASRGIVIREAVLTTWFVPQGARRHRLLMRIATTEASSLTLNLPAGAALSQVRRDNQPIDPIGSLHSKVPGLIIPIPPPHPARPSCSVQLDYQTPASTTNLLLSPENPTTDLPCLSFCWEVITPTHWILADPGPGLTSTEPRVAENARSVLGAWPGWSENYVAMVRRLGLGFGRGPRAQSVTRLTNLDQLDARVVATHTEETTLGEWFARWDNGPVPLLIDRMALDAAGLGPRSRVAPGPTVANPSRAALDALQPLGLTLIERGEGLIITSTDYSRDLDDSDAAWKPVVREAAARGSDPSDRFQTVVRWRREATPRFSIQGRSAERERMAEGWHRRLFVAAGWPGPSDSVHLVNTRDRSRETWCLALSIVIVGIAGRNMGPRIRAATLLALLAMTLAILVAVPGRMVPVVRGGLMSELAVLFFWLGQGLTWPSWRRNTSESRISTVTRLRNVGLTTSVLLATCIGLAWSERPRAATTQGEPPIVALFPYEGLPDPDRRPDRVVLLWTDYQRLLKLAETPTEAAGRSTIALGATHRVVRGSEARNEAIVTTELILEAGQGQPAEWTFPIADSREIVATLDGGTLPLRITESGRTATITIGTGEIDQAGPRRLRVNIRRIVSVRHDDSGDRLRLAINPLPSARVFVLDPGKGGGEDRPVTVDVPNARGDIDAKGDQGISAHLGPVDHLEVRWSSGTSGVGGSGPERTAGRVEALMLWDALAAGDRLRARLTYFRAGGTPMIRLAVAPGLALRPITIPGLVDATWQGTDDRPLWEARLDPPLADGASIETGVLEAIARRSRHARSAEDRAPGCRTDRESGGIASSFWLERTADGQSGKPVRSSGRRGIREELGRPGLRASHTGRSGPHAPRLDDLRATQSTRAAGAGRDRPSGDDRARSTALRLSSRSHESFGTARSARDLPSH